MYLLGSNQLKEIFKNSTWVQDGDSDFYKTTVSVPNDIVAEEYASQLADAVLDQIKGKNEFPVSITLGAGDNDNITVSLSKHDVELLKSNTKLVGVAILTEDQVTAAQRTL